jgi:spore coat protein U-like protein
MRPFLPPLLAATVVLACAAPGLARGATACTVSTTGIAFGTYSPIGNGSRESVGSVDVSCSATAGGTVSYAITFTAGAGTYSARQMASGANRLAYNLFTDSPRTLVWGDGSGGTSFVSDRYSLVTSPTARSYNVYGRIPGGQTRARVGSYSDNITVTVTY